MAGMVCRLAFFWRMYLFLILTTVRPMSFVTLAQSPFFASAAPLVHIHLLPARKNTVSFSVAHLSMPSANDGLLR